MTAPESSLPNSHSAAPPLPAVFELCHAGVVLRALLGVQGVLALMLALQYDRPERWWQQLLEASAVSVPALLGWLLVVCGLKLQLAVWPMLRVRLALLSLGAFCAWMPWWLGAQMQAMLDQQPASPWRGVVIAVAGATAAAFLLQWILLRARAQTPQGMQARWVELQSRIRPHFLFNTLNTAVALVRVEPRQAERVLEDLGELFQAALSAPDWVSTVGEEIGLARRYLDIEQLRFGERLRLQWQLDPACDHARLPPLLLQPLVENAVRYGVEPNEGGGEVLVRTRRQGGMVELVVRNSLGAAAAGGHGLALNNVRERLNLLHDLDCRFELEPEPERFTVRITLPL
ncbi:two-component system sensor histidine kinase AlgZ [Inhella inkyongensis]|uniref:Two-component system sensor histidine kinase AlgZ n=1 Tax=Inhella inkyongensis TaxID=392593 RepID=A0A840SAG4_9BURK|nr:histidine kinase [Inhella inkyongensis]MBB5206006.1 two-component system sensor histidine kinase AlgZ [Inhella inkyongensis]